MLVADLGDVVACAEDEGLIDLLDGLQGLDLVGGRLGLLAEGQRGQGDARGLRRAELLLAPAGVVQARAEDLVEIEVGHHEVFLEGPAARDPLALLVEDEGLPVEDELVLAAHRVDEGQADEIVGGPRGQHLLAELGLARVVGRGVDRHHELGSRQGLQGGGPRGIPDVLADVGREHRVAHDEHGRLRAGLEVAVLVEDAVVGQVLLVVRAHLRAVVENGRGIEDVITLVDIPDHRRDAPALAGHVRQRPQVGLDERRLEEQVLGRVAREGELGEGHEVAARRAGALHPVQDEPRIGLDGADRRIDLRQPHADASHGAYSSLWSPSGLAWPGGSCGRRSGSGHRPRPYKW